MRWDREKTRDRRASSVGSSRLCVRRRGRLRAMRRRLFIACIGAERRRHQRYPRRQAADAGDASQSPTSSSSRSSGGYTSRSWYFCWEFCRPRCRLYDEWGAQHLSPDYDDSEIDFDVGALRDSLGRITYGTLYSGRWSTASNVYSPPN